MGIDRRIPGRAVNRPRLRNFIVDVTPLRQAPRYRWMFAAHGIGWIGRQITVVAVPFQLYEITQSTVKVGALGLVQFVATLSISLAGGAIADAVDKRKTLLITQVGLAGTAALLAWNAANSQPLEWPLYVLTGVNAAFSAIDLPTRAATIPALVGKALLPEAYALQQTLSNVAKAAGPAFAGFLIATTDLEVTYVVEVGCFLATTLLISRIGPLPPAPGAARPGWRSIGEGFRYLRGEKLLIANFAMDLNAMVFGMPSALFPAIGTTLLGGSAGTVGLLYSGPGIGAFVAALTSGWVGGVKRQGRMVLAAVIVWGAAIATFGLTKSTMLAVGLLAVAGAADVISAVFRNTILQTAVPDSLRGRVSGVHIAVVAGGPRLGDFEAGAVAAATSLQFSVISGGLACILGSLLIARKAPEFARYVKPDP
jgi:MFS family permease